MQKLKLPFMVLDRDRHGNIRAYVRLPGRAKVRIRERIGSPEFVLAYQRAITENVQARISPRAGNPVSFRALSVRYYSSAAFTTLDLGTQARRRRHLDVLARGHGDKPVAVLEPKHVRRLRDELKEKPTVANKRLKALRALFAWATEAEEAARDPTSGVRLLKYASDGHHTWTTDDIAMFEARHPLGSKAHLALSLLLYTGCRREDVVRLGPQHMPDGRLRYRQAKNEHRAPVDLDIPVHPDLRAGIAATPSGHLTFLTTSFAKPFSAAGFGNKFREWCNEAGLRDCSAHGLRKATAARLAERGATAHEIMAITGHKSLEEVERYTRAAQRGKLGDEEVQIRNRFCPTECPTCQPRPKRLGKTEHPDPGGPDRAQRTEELQRLTRRWDGNQYHRNAILFLVDVPPWCEILRAFCGTRGLVKMNFSIRKNS